MTYQPNKAIPAGNTILRTLKREGLTQKNLSDRTGLSEKHLSQIINGDASITLETAFLLENALGGTTSFWINLENNYQETKARLERSSLLLKEVSLVSLFPYAELAKRGYVEATRREIERVENLWKFFAVNSLNFVEKTQPVAYRKRATSSNKDTHIATWLRCGEIEAQKNEVGEYSELKLKQSLPDLRKLSVQKPEEFSRTVKNILAEVGISVVYVEHFSGTGVSGAVRWSGNNPIIQLSLLGTYADMFWFNLFHEIGHLIQHGKKDQFIEFKSLKERIVNEKEKEADEFASNVLIPKIEYSEFLSKTNFSKDSVKSFADTLDIHPEIVEGRLLHEGKIHWKKSLGFRRQLKMA
jgi:HTH-type transcriptional regulator/antitoxin HigA